MRRQQERSTRPREQRRRSRHCCANERVGRSMVSSLVRTIREPSLDRANSRYVLLQKGEYLPHLTDSLVGVEGRVTGREDVGLMRVLPSSKPLDIHHCLPIGTATVVPADQEKDRGADVIDEVDRVPIAHQLGNVTRFSSEQRSIVGLEQRRKVLVT